MSAVEDFINLLETTEVVKQVLKSIKEEPARVLGEICREYQSTRQSVPDHHLSLSGYLGEATLKALMSLGLVRQDVGGRLSIYSYEPTPAGLKQFEKLSEEGFYRRPG